MHSGSWCRAALYSAWTHTTKLLTQGHWNLFSCFFFSTLKFLANGFYILFFSDQIFMYFLPSTVYVLPFQKKICPKRLRSKSHLGPSTGHSGMCAHTWIINGCVLTNLSHNRGCTTTCTLKHFSLEGFVRTFTEHRLTLCPLRLDSILIKHFGNTEQKWYSWYDF